MCYTEYNTGASRSPAELLKTGAVQTMAWYDNAVFYHIYPLGLCGCAHENDGQPVPGAFKKLDAWAQHAAKLGCTAIYIGPLFESGSHGYDTIDYRLVDRRLGTNEEFKEFVAACHERGQKVIVDGVFNHVGRDFFAFHFLIILSPAGQDISPTASFFIRKAKMPLTFLPNAIIPTLSKENKSRRSLKQRISCNPSPRPNASVRLPVSGGVCPCSFFQSTPASKPEL